MAYGIDIYKGGSGQHKLTNAIISTLKLQAVMTVNGTNGWAVYTIPNGLNIRDVMISPRVQSQTIYSYCAVQYASSLTQFAFWGYSGYSYKIYFYGAL